MKKKKWDGGLIPFFGGGGGGGRGGGLCPVLDENVDWNTEKVQKNTIY